MVCFYWKSADFWGSSGSSTLLCLQDIVVGQSGSSCSSSWLGVSHAFPSLTLLISWQARQTQTACKALQNTWWRLWSSPFTYSVQKILPFKFTCNFSASSSTVSLYITSERGFVWSLLLQSPHHLFFEKRHQQSNDGKTNHDHQGSFSWPPPESHFACPLDREERGCRKKSLLLIFDEECSFLCCPIKC